MRMSFHVKYDDGREVVAVTKNKDIVAFERQYRQSFGSMDSATMEWIFYLAWSPLHRSGAEPRAFDEFLDDVDEITPLGEESQPAPFPTVPSDEPSPA